MGMANQDSDPMRVRILFVDDDRLVLRALARALRLERERWLIAFVLGGANAIRALTSQEWDIVVTDLEMAGIDGRAVIRAARETNPSATCFVHTAADIEATTLDGCDVIPKPCPVADLRELLARVAASRVRR